MRRPQSPLEGRPPFVDVMRKLGLPPDPWQVQVLESRAPQTLLNCCRQAGKSTVVAVLALMEAMCQPLTKVVVVSRSFRQSRELLATIRLFHQMLGAGCSKAPASMS